MAKINIEFDGKIYSIDENALASLAAPLERALIQQLAGTGAVIRFGGTNYNVDANKLASARNVLTNHFGTVAGTDTKVTVAGTEYGLSKTKLTNAVETMNEVLNGISEPVLEPSEGLEFGLLIDGASYALVGMGTCTDIDLVIPSHYNGLPVTRILTYNDEYQIPEDSPPEDDELIEIDYDREKYEGISLYNSNVRSIVIPGTVKTIEAYSFRGCDHIESVVLCEGVVSIENGAFESCNNLMNITIPSSVTYIGGGVFINYLVGNMHNIHIHINAPENSVAGAPWGAYNGTIYWNSTGPTAETMQSPRFVLNDDGVSYCVANVGDYTSTDIVIPDTYNGLPVTIIAGHAFAYNTRITSVTIPNSVTSIWDDAFVQCDGLTSLTIGNGVRHIGGSLFGWCQNLTNIVFDGTIAQWNAIQKDTYWKYGIQDVPATYIQCTNGQVAL